MRRRPLPRCTWRAQTPVHMQVSSQMRLCQQELLPPGAAGSDPGTHLPAALLSEPAAAPAQGPLPPLLGKSQHHHHRRSLPGCIWTPLTHPGSPHGFPSAAASPTLPLSAQKAACLGDGSGPPQPDHLRPQLAWPPFQPCPRLINQSIHDSARQMPGQQSGWRISDLPEMHASPQTGPWKRQARLSSMGTMAHPARALLSCIWGTSPAGMTARVAETGDTDHHSDS